MFFCIAENECTCDDGTAASGAACTQDGASICASCGDGFTITCDKTACRNIGLTLRDEETTECSVGAFCIGADAGLTLLGGSGPRGSGGGKGSGGGSSGSKIDTLDLGDLRGGSKSQSKSTFGEWASTSDKQECRSECRPKSKAGGSY